MENEVFERDYTNKASKHDENDLSEAIFNKVFFGSFIDKYAAAIDALPKIINQKSKENYEYVLAICDSMAREFGGKLTARVSYDSWDATIRMTLHHIEFTNDEQLEDLKQIASRADSVTFSATPDGQVQLSMFFYYFEDVISEEDADRLGEEIFASEPELVALLEQKAEQDESKLIAAADALNQILDIAEERTGRDRTELLKELAQMNFEDPEKFQAVIMEMLGMTELPDDM